MRDRRAPATFPASAPCGPARHGFFLTIVPVEWAAPIRVTRGFLQRQRPPRAGPLTGDSTEVEPKLSNRITGSSTVSRGSLVCPLLSKACLLFFFFSPRLPACFFLRGSRGGRSFGPGSLCPRGPGSGRGRCAGPV